MVWPGYGSWREAFWGCHPPRGEALIDTQRVEEVLVEDKVYITRGQKDRRRYLLKSITPENDIDWRNLFMEVRHLRELSGTPGFTPYSGHAPLVHPSDASAAAANISTVILLQELVPGMSLRDFLLLHVTPGGPDQVNLSEWTRRLLRTVLLALKECHDRGICHRDVKSENIMLAAPPDPESARVIDFGFSSIIDYPVHPWADQCLGTAAFLAPELLTGPGSADPAVDLYAVGILLFECLHVHHLTPYEHPQDAELQCQAQRASERADIDKEVDEAIYQRIIRRQPQTRAAGLVSLAWADDLFRKLTCDDPAQRLSAAQALDHPFCRPPRITKPPRVVTIDDLHDYL